ncbi:hypothetical protein GWK90_05550 [Candidatus Hamiltonella defensa]|uniref:HU family DNA-binding protein n=1 Tax=Candidatus Williamhamiltonella TaxID=568987 RepID=UPI000F4EE2BB|nr:hypothetical protein [Candidatus Hamiltonella defensa]
MFVFSNFQVNPRAARAGFNSQTGAVHIPATNILVFKADQNFTGKGLSSDLLSEIYF